MDQTPCVLLEALKQLVGETGGTESNEDVLMQESKESAARAKQALALLNKRKKKVKDTPVGTAEPAASNVLPLFGNEVSAPAPAPAVAPAPATSVKGAALILTSREARWSGEHLLLSKRGLSALIKGADYFSRDISHALDMLHGVLGRGDAVTVILQTSHALQSREVKEVRVQEQQIAFALGEVQVAEGGELNGELTLFFGNLE